MEKVSEWLFLLEAQLVSKPRIKTCILVFGQK